MSPVSLLRLTDLGEQAGVRIKRLLLCDTLQEYLTHEALFPGLAGLAALGGIPMKILANLRVERYFQISGVNILNDTG